MVSLHFTRRQLLAKSKLVMVNDMVKDALTLMLNNNRYNALGCENCYQSIFKLHKYCIQKPPPLREFEMPSEIVEGKIFLGSCYSAINRAWMAENQVAKIVVCAPNLPLYFENDPGLQYMRLPIEDCGEVNILNHFSNCMSFINSDGTVLVHCRAGISRSASVVIAWMMLRDRICYEEALKRVRSKRSIVNPNWSFVTQLKELYANEIFK